MRATQGKLSHWIDVLNKFDEILEDYVARGLPADMRSLVIAILNFTVMLVIHNTQDAWYKSRKV